MLDEEDEVAFSLFTADTGNASRVDWNLFGNRDKYERMARAAINRINQLNRHGANMNYPEF